MENGIRFDLEYETMPWHRVDAVVFDIGNILIRYAPNDFLEQLFPGDEQKQRDMMARVYRGPFWENFDRGTMEYADAAQKLQILILTCHPDRFMALPEATRFDLEDIRGRLVAASGS